MSTSWPTPRSWPKDSYPTSEQLAEWMAEATVAERVAFAEQAIAAIERSRHCLMAHP